MNITQKKEAAGEVLSLEEAERDTGMSRASIYNYMNKLGIQGWKFPMDRRTYLDASDVARMKAYKNDPRKAGAHAQVKEKRQPRIPA